MVQDNTGNDGVTRRSFLKSVAGATLAAGIPAAAIGQTPTPAPEAEKAFPDPVAIR